MTPSNSSIGEILWRLFVLAVLLTARGIYRLAEWLYGELYAYAMDRRRVK